MLVGRAQARWADRVTRGSVRSEGRGMRTNAAPTGKTEALAPAVAEKASTAFAGAPCKRRRYGGVGTAGGRRGARRWSAWC